MPQLTTLIPSFAAPVTDRVWLGGAPAGGGRRPLGRRRTPPPARCR